MKGFTFIEMLVALAIIALVSVISLQVISKFNTAKILDMETEKTLSILQKARLQTLSAKDGFEYGVHFEERKIVLFKGQTYNIGTPSNLEYRLVPAVGISAVSLTGGGVNAVFKKLTGATEQNGFVRLSLAGDANASSTITIEGTGIAY